MDSTDTELGVTAGLLAASHKVSWQQHLITAAVTKAAHAAIVYTCTAIVNTASFNTAGEAQQSRRQGLKSRYHFYKYTNHQVCLSIKQLL